MNKIFITLSVGFAILLGGCDEAPTRYSFDKEDFEENIKNYVLTKDPQGKMGCQFSSVIFLKDVQVALKNKTHKGMELFSLSDKSPGATISISKDKIYWEDFGVETTVNNGVISPIKGMGAEDIEGLSLISKGDTIQIKVRDKEIECLFPFKKVG